MTEKLKQKIKEGILNAPKELKETIESFNWDTPSIEIGKKHYLSESEINDLQVEIGLIFMGYTDIENLAINIEGNLVTSKEEAEKIAKEVKEKIKIEQKEKKADWKQNINFILSGGDYSVFLKRIEAEKKLNDTMAIEKVPVNHSKIEDLKNNFTI